MSSGIGITNFPSYTTAICVGIMAGFLLGTLYFLTSVVTRLMNLYMSRRIEKALLRRRNTEDAFRDENGYSWDVVLAFSIYDADAKTSVHQRLFSTKYILSKLVEAGLEYRLFYNLKHNLVYCKLRADTKRFMIEADRINMQMELDERGLETLCRTGRPGLWEPLTIPDTSVETNVPPFKYIFGSFQYEAELHDVPSYLQPVYKRYSNPRLLKRSSFSTASPMLEEASLRHVSTNTHGETAGGSGAKSIGHHQLELQVEGFDVIEDKLIFKSADRLKLIDSILNNRLGGGCGLDIENLLKTNCLAGYLPLHDHVLLLTLEKEWLQLFQFPWKQRTKLVKDYFGERIGLFFVFLGHQTTWLISVAVVGFGCWLNVAVYNNDPNALIMPYFAAFISLWTTFFLASFKKREVKTAMQWGMTNFEETESDRPQFVGVEIKSSVSGKQILYFSSQERFRRSIRSYVVLLLSLMIAVGVLALLLFIRVLIGLTPASIAVADVITSVFVSMQIEILNRYYLRVALNLNDYENYRTESEYDDALIAKTFIFQFINSFGCLFYISFVQPFSGVDPCLSGNCYKELQTTLGSIFLTRLLIGNVLKVTHPMLRTFLQVRESLMNSENRGAAQAKREVGQTMSVDEPLASDTAKYELSEIEKTFTLAEYDPLLGTFEDYSNMATQFGFMTMFVAAFPLTTLLAFVNNYVELRVNAWRLCQVCRRPKPRCAEDIGTWFLVFEIIGVAAVFVNAGIVSFTGTYLLKLEWPLRVWIFILMSTFTLLIKGTIRYLSPSRSQHVDIQVKRNTFITRKVIDNAPDKSREATFSSIRVRPNYRIHTHDETL